MQAEASSITGVELTEGQCNRRCSSQTPAARRRHGECWLRVPPLSFIWTDRRFSPLIRSLCLHICVFEEVEARRSIRRPATASQPAVGGSDCEPRLTRRKRLAGSGFSRSRDGCLNSHDSTVKKCESFFFCSIRRNSRLKLRRKRSSRGRPGPVLVCVCPVLSSSSDQTKKKSFSLDW